MNDIQSCKERRECPKLISRQYYFEPNPDTIDEWRRKGFYKGPLDHRVVFVCESPGNKHKTKNKVEPRLCWNNTPQDRRFEEVRKAFGFINCYITNTVKCGVRRGNQHNDNEIAACRRFLLRELQLIEPMVVVGVGDNAFRTLREKILPMLAEAPVVFQITHFSARGRKVECWEREFPELRRLLGRLKPRKDW
jgi:uracil-DNA glycosylase family 4